MSNKVKEESDFLSLVAKADPQQRLALLSTATSNQVLVLREIIINILRGRFALTAEQIQVLNPFKRFLRLLSQSSSTLSASRTLLRRHSKHIQILLQTVWSHLHPLLRDEESRSDTY